MKITLDPQIIVETKTPRGEEISIRGGKALFILNLGKNKELTYYRDELNSLIDILVNYRDERKKIDGN
jgi:hypothetical protein